MTWSDIFTEIQLKLGIKRKSKLRKPNITRYSIDKFKANANIVKGQIEREFERRLENRSVVAPYLRTDDRLFEPYADLLALLTVGSSHFSFVREVGKDLMQTTKEFEDDNGVLVNKSHLYFGLSINSIYLNDTINAMIYWELSQKEESHVAGGAFNAAAAINNTIGRFTSVTNPIDYSLRNNDLYQSLRSNYNFISEFSVALATQQSPEIFSYFSSALRFRQIDNWLKTEFTAMSKIYAQELVNSLCILCEASLKNFPVVTKNMIGPIINHDLININATVSSLLGHNAPSPVTGLFVTYPCLTEVQFNTNFPVVITSLKSGALSEDEVKAHLLYGAYLLRNKSLHDYNPDVFYFNNASLFGDTIGFLFAAVQAIQKL